MRVAKVVCVGESGVGKSSLLNRIVNQSFDRFESSTIGAAYASIKRELDGETFHFQWWDCAGQSRYNSLVPMYYRGAAVVLVCMEASTPADRVQYWIDDARSHTDGAIVLVGTKMDVSLAREDFNIDCRTSAATGEGCEEMLRHISQYATESQTTSSSLRLDGRQPSRSLPFWRCWS